MEIIAVHGVGMVGGALSRYFEEKGFDVRNYDPFKKLEDDISPAEIQFVCVPTPYKPGGAGFGSAGKDGGGFDLSMAEDAFANIAKTRGDKKTIVIIKSTALPGTSKYFQDKYPQFSVLFNPEFLTEKNADKDMAEPERQIVGYVKEGGDVDAQKIMDLLPDAPYKKIMKATEAELVKYFGNAFLASKVIFANMMYDFCEKLGIDYDVVKDGAAHDERVGKSHLQVLHNGTPGQNDVYRGYGGSCFPKDVRALIQQGGQLGVDVSILKEMERRNSELTGGVDR